MTDSAVPIERSKEPEAIDLVLSVEPRVGYALARLIDDARSHSIGVFTHLRIAKDGATEDDGSVSGDDAMDLLDLFDDLVKFKAVRRIARKRGGEWPTS